MGKHLLLPILGIALATAVPVAAQDARLTPTLVEPRLWEGMQEMDEPLPLRSGISQSAPSSAWSRTYLAGYLVGGLTGLELGARGAAPSQLRPWLGGWYDGVSVSPDPSALGIGSAPWWTGASGSPAAVTSPPGGQPAVADGLLEGFLRGLRLNAGRWAGR